MGTDKTTTHVVFLGLGTNLGRKEENIQRAIRMVGERIGSVVAQSALYHSEPWGFQSENRFVNAAICCCTSLSPHELLHATQQIEREMGRRHKSTDGQYHDRIIDIDILYYDSLTLHTPSLTIPHPHISERAFVLAPLAEIAPGHIDPVSGLTAAQMLAALEAKGGALEAKGNAPEVYGRSVEIKGGSVGTKRGAVGTK